MNSRKLDFLLIGAQKGGTTSLWRYLNPHPRICIARIKEAAFFTVSDSSDQLARYMDIVFADAPADSLLGDVTPDYMIGDSTANVEVLAERMTSMCPEVKLIALLRDPIERAVSAYLMAVRRGQEKRSVDVALNELLDQEELANARLRPSPTNSYVAAGEYGRVLGIYRSVVPADQLLAVFTEDLGRDAGAVLDTVLGFLALPVGFRPEGLDIHHFRGGSRKLLDPEAERLLVNFHREQVLPYMRGSPRLNKRVFELFYETWNVASGDKPPEISGDIRARLEEHFEADAGKLRALGIAAPWIARWESQRP